MSAPRKRTIASKPRIPQLLPAALQVRDSSSYRRGATGDGHSARDDTFRFELLRRKKVEAGVHRDRWQRECKSGGIRQKDIARELRCVRAQHLFT
jgi:hypothetical protein